jgi:hypothetical protein
VRFIASTVEEIDEEVYDMRQGLSNRLTRHRSIDPPQPYREKESLPILVVLRHGRGSGGEVGDEREPVGDLPGVLDLGDLRVRGQKTLLPQGRQFGLRRAHRLLHRPGADERRDLRQQIGMGLRLEEAAARRAIVVLRKRAGFDQELLDYLDADASLLGGGGEGMQAALGDDLADQRLPGRDGPVIEDAVAQHAAEDSEAGLVQVIAGEAAIQGPEHLVGRIEMPRGRRRDPVECRADGGLAVAGDVEAGGVIGTVCAIHATKMSRTKSVPEVPAEGRRGEQGLVLQPRLLPPVLKPIVQPEIVGGGDHGRPVKGSREDVCLDPGQARGDVIPIDKLIGPPDFDQRMAVPDADEGLPQLPVPAHRHGGGRRSLMPCCILAQADGAPPHHRVTQRAGHEELAAERHADVPHRDPAPREQVLDLTRIELGPSGQGFDGGRVQVEEPPDLGAHVAGERDRLGPPGRRDARQVGEHGLPGRGRRIADGQERRMAQGGGAVGSTVTVGG